MASFIAFCENPSCGAIFEVPIITGGPGSATITMTNSKAGPCPICKSYGLIPDGVYKYAEETISILTGPEISIRVLKEVQKYLRKVKLSTKEDVLKEVHSISPKAAEALTKAPTLPNFANWILFVIAIIGFAILVHTSYFKKSDIENQFIQHLLKENESLKNDRNDHINNTNTFKKNSQKKPRNSPCPCGSGLKYKKCCRLIEI